MESTCRSDCEVVTEEIVSWTVETMESTPEIVSAVVSEPEIVTVVESVPEVVTTCTVESEPEMIPVVESAPEVVTTLEATPEVVTEIITETVETMEAEPSTYIETQSTPLTNIKSLPATFSESASTSYVEPTPSTFGSTLIESRVSPYMDSTSSPFTESATSALADSAQSSYMESTPSAYSDGMTAAYSESRLQEAELIINLSSRSRRNMANPTLTQVNTSIAGSENYVPSLAATSTNISISEAFVNPMPSIGDASTSIEIQTDSEVVDTVGGNEHDPILEENTVAIMGQVTSNAALLNENSESGRNDECVSDNVIVISVIDEDANQSKKKMKNVLVGTTEGEPVPDAIYLPNSSGREIPVPTSLIMNKHKLMGPAEPEITIERKKFHECLVCKAKFKSIMDLFRHRVEHNESMKSMFKCEKCDLTFNDPVELEKHKLSAHSGHRLYKCSICQDTFTLLHNYKCHLRIHNNIGPYVCNMCYRVFDKKSQFISHMDDHEFATTNPYRHRLQCNVCDKIFSEDGKLKRHMLTHSAKREYKCNICTKAFLERHKLTRHMLSHTGKRDFQCPECEKSFTLKHNLTIHMRIHENLRPYQCLVCKRTFIQKIVLQRHLRIHQDYLIEQSQKFSQKYVN